MNFLTLSALVNDKESSVTSILAISLGRYFVTFLVLFYPLCTALLFYAILISVFA